MGETVVRGCDFDPKGFSNALAPSDNLPRRASGAVSQLAGVALAVRLDQRLLVPEGREREPADRPDLAASRNLTDS